MSDQDRSVSGQVTRGPQAHLLERRLQAGVMLAELARVGLQAGEKGPDEPRWSADGQEPEQ